MDSKPNQGRKRERVEEFLERETLKRGNVSNFVPLALKDVVMVVIVGFGFVCLIL